MNYIINYTAKNSRKVVIESKTMQVKNRDNDFMAKVSLEAHLKKKLPDFYSLEIHSCEVDNAIPDFFKDLFK